jgi:hypothetical protein
MKLQFTPLGLYIWATWHVLGEWPSVLGTRRLGNALGEWPLVARAYQSVGRGGCINPERTWPQLNPAAPSPVSGMVEPIGEAERVGREPLEWVPCPALDWLTINNWPHLTTSGTEPQRSRSTSQSWPMSTLYRIALMTYEPLELRCINGLHTPRPMAHLWPIGLGLSV